MYDVINITVAISDDGNAVTVTTLYGDRNDRSTWRTAESRYGLSDLDLSVVRADLTALLQKQA